MVALDLLTASLSSRTKKLTFVLSLHKYVWCGSVIVMFYTRISRVRMLFLFKPYPKKIVFFGFSFILKNFKT